MVKTKMCVFDRAGGPARSGSHRSISKFTTPLQVEDLVCTDLCAVGFVIYNNVTGWSHLLLKPDLLVV